jgi:hypothetical protein
MSYQNFLMRLSQQVAGMEGVKLDEALESRSFARNLGAISEISKLRRFNDYRSGVGAPNGANAKELSFRQEQTLNLQSQQPTGFAPFSRKLPWPDRKFVASHSEYACFGNLVRLRWQAISETISSFLLERC